MERQCESGGLAMIDQHPEIQSLLIVAWFSSIGGIAYHLWFGRNISARQWVGALLLSGFCGVLTYLWLYEDVSSHLKLIAVSILAGIGGTSLLDLAVSLFADKIRGFLNGK
jgi:hypothetical protein